MTTQFDTVIQHLRRTAILQDVGGLTDGQLLETFVSRREEAPLEVLMRRHGPMVWGVCHRILHNYHDAEDAFQATFLVLVRKAGSIVPREMVGNWLYGVANQTALKARATTAKRQARERQVADMPEPVVMQQDLSSNLQTDLDQELRCLPDKYRVAIVLCDLEGKTRREAARQLGCPEGTLAARLARGRVMLAKRLTRHGVTLSSGALAAVISQTVASAAVPTSVMTSTIYAVTLVAAGKTAAVGLVSTKVATLTEGVLKAMMMSKLKAVVAVVLVLGFIVTGATALSYRMAAAQGDQPPAAEARVATPQKQEKEKEAFTAWGKEVGGLQAGLGYDAGQKRAYRHGETVRLVLRVRNVSKKEVEFVCCRQYFMEVSPSMTDGQGKPVRLPRDAYTPKPRQEKVSLAPGKEIELYELKFKLRPAGENGDEDNATESADFAGTVFTFYGTGKFQIHYERLIEKPWAGDELDPTLRKLATGKLELEVKAEEREKTPPKDLGKIQPPGGVPLFLGRRGEEIRVDGIEKARKRLEAVPEKDLEKWIVELERIIGKKLKDGVPSARQVCRTDFVIHLSVAFDDLKWNAKTADDLFKRAQTMPAPEAKFWKEAFEALLKKEIGQTDTEIFDGGPVWAVPLVLIPVDALHEGQKYSAERGKKYLARMRQLTADDVSLWKDKVDEFEGTKLDAAVNIILLDDYFDQEKFQRDKFKAAIGARKK